MGLLDTIKNAVNKNQLESQQQTYNTNGLNLAKQLNNNSYHQTSNVENYNKIDDIYKYLCSKVENGELIPIKVSRYDAVKGYRDERVCFCIDENIYYKNTTSVYEQTTKGKRWSPNIKAEHESKLKPKEQDFYYKKGDILLVDGNSTIVGKKARIVGMSVEQFQKLNYDEHLMSAFTVLKDALKMLGSSKTPEDVMQTLVDKRKASKLVQNDSLDDKLNSLTPDTQSNDNRDSKNKENDGHEI